MPGWLGGTVGLAFVQLAVKRSWVPAGYVGVALQWPCITDFTGLAPTG